ncbi:hypothetical protein LI328DRAFT_133815 [Trichoderma asperelloides]|nr:hypothetical protein LI328DRAFT_133815 [Trichoderma asperelloides]
MALLSLGCIIRQLFSLVKSWPIILRLQGKMLTNLDPCFVLSWKQFPMALTISPAPSITASIQRRIIQVRVEY